MPEVNVGRLRIAYEEWGSGDPIVLVNGTGESARGWGSFGRRLAAGRRVVAIDCRDTGHSSYSETSYTPRDLGGDVAAVIEAAGAGPAVVLGYSLGGAAAQELAAARPDLVRSLVLVSTWPRTDAWFAAQMRSWQALRSAHEDDEEAFLRALCPWIFAPATYESGLVDRYVAGGVAEEPRQHPQGFLRQCDADIAHDASSRLGAIRAPALVLVGEEDVCTPPRYSRALCEALGSAAELIVYPDAGHGAVWERPADLARDVESFLARA